MARRKNTETDETTETVTETVEAPEVTETDTETTEAEKAPEPEVDLTEFQNAAQAAVADADTSTGEVPPASVDPVNVVYRNLDGAKAKGKARKYLEEQMKAALDKSDLPTARAFIDLREAMSSAGGTSTPKAPADPTEAFVNKVASLILAANIVQGDVPEGVEDNWDEKASAMVDDLESQVESYQAFRNSEDEDAEEPQVSPVVRAAFKLAAGRASGGSGARRTGPRRDVLAHINQVFEGLESGDFLTVSEIANMKSAEYGDDAPSAGAVSQRLFPKDKDAFASETIVAAQPDGRPKGAQKV